MAITRYGFTGPMAAYGTFAPKSTTVSTLDGFSSMMLMGVGHLWWLLVVLR